LQDITKENVFQPKVLFAVEFFTQETVGYKPLILWSMGMQHLQKFIVVAGIFGVLLGCSISKQGNLWRSPEEGGFRNWQVSGGTDMHMEARGDSTILARLDDGALLDNLGCQKAGADMWCDVQELGGGPRGFVRSDFLTAAISPNGAAMTGPDDSAIRAGEKQFNATSSIPCTLPGNPSIDQCALGVARAGGGYATVVINLPNGSERIIFFRMGKAIGVSTSEATPTGEFRVEKHADINLISVGLERYELPDAVVLGG
jgi:hypothetical protein